MRRSLILVAVLALAGVAQAQCPPGVDCRQSSEPKATETCEADNARLRAALAELSRVLAKLGVAADDAALTKNGQE